jgi:hypothetical protein
VAQICNFDFPYVTEHHPQLHDAEVTPTCTKCDKEPSRVLADPERFYMPFQWDGPVMHMVAVCMEKCCVFSEVETYTLLVWERVEVI